jgi:hypothetical protein
MKRVHKQKQITTKNNSNETNNQNIVFKVFLAE